MSRPTCCTSTPFGGHPDLDPTHGSLSLGSTPCILFTLDTEPGMHSSPLAALVLEGRCWAVSWEGPCCCHCSVTAESGPALLSHPALGLPV